MLLDKAAFILSILSLILVIIVVIMFVTHSLSIKEDMDKLERHQRRDKIQMVELQALILQMMSEKEQSVTLFDSLQLPTPKSLMTKIAHLRETEQLKPLHYAYECDPLNPLFRQFT